MTIRELSSRGMCVTYVSPFLVMANIELCARCPSSLLNGFTARCRKTNLASCPRCLEQRSSEVCPGIMVGWSVKKPKHLEQRFCYITLRISTQRGKHGVCSG